MNKIVKQLRREARTHPAKAVFLGGLGLLALWFWVPLAASWIAPDDPKPENTAAASPMEMAVATPTRPGIEQGPVDASRHSWQRLTQWMDADPRTWATHVSVQRRDPFANPQSEVVEEPIGDETDESPQAMQAEITPESLGMALCGTVVGPNRRMARIGKNLYRPEDTLVVEKDGQEIEFKLAEVHARHVVLQHGQTRFELRIPTRAGAGRIEAFKDP